MIGAILGIQREKVAEIFKVSDTRIAVRPLSSIQKDSLPQNWRQTAPSIRKGKFALDKMHESFQSNLEVIRRPHYCIIFWHRNEQLLQELTERLKSKGWFYPPYLGIMGFLADVEWESEDTAEEYESDQEIIYSVLPLTEAMAQRIDLSGSEAYIREERIPYEVFPDRRFRHLDLAYVPRNANPLVVRAQEGEFPLFALKRSQWKGVFFEQCAT
jgi:CRISPR-associated protein Cas5h